MTPLKLLAALALLGVRPVHAQVRWARPPEAMVALPWYAVDDGRSGGNGPDERKGAVWVSAGIGGADLGLAYDASLNLMHRRFIYTLDAWGCSGRQLSVGVFGGQGPWRNFGSYDLTVSRVLTRADASLVVSAGAGISWSFMTYRTEVGRVGLFSTPVLEATTESNVGLPLVLRCDVPTSTAVGAEFGLRADINSEATMVAVIFGLRVGRIWRPGDARP